MHRAKARTGESIPDPQTSKIYTKTIKGINEVCWTCITNNTKRMPIRPKTKTQSIHYGLPNTANNCKIVNIYAKKITRAPQGRKIARRLLCPFEQFKYKKKYLGRGGLCMATLYPLSEGCFSDVRGPFRIQNPKISKKWSVRKLFTLLRLF